MYELNIFDLYNTNEIIYIVVCLLLTNIVKIFLKERRLYVYIPLLFSIVIFLFLFFIKQENFDNFGLFVLKIWAGSVLFYDAIMKKIQRIFENNNNDYKNNIGEEQ